MDFTTPKPLRFKEIKEDVGSVVTRRPARKQQAVARADAQPAQRPRKTKLPKMRRPKRQP
jgi:hypothetical protein